MNKNTVSYDDKEHKTNWDMIITYTHTQKRQRFSKNK